MRMMSPFCFLHFTDPHVPPPGETVMGGDAARTLAAALADAAGRHGPDSPLPAAFAVVTGDLVRDGEPAAYARLRSMLDGLPWPVHLMLGNHDDRDAFRQAFPAAPLDGAGFVQQAFQTPAGTCVMLDTHAPGRPHGELCAQRLQWLSARLSEAAGPVLLFLHHPPVPVGIPAMDGMGLRDAEALWQAVAPHRARVRHIFHGHLHRPIAGSWRGIPLSSVRGTAFGVALDQRPGNVAVSRQEPPCYAFARAAGEDLVVHTIELPDARQGS
jgi:3',5'-cyclic-AMP phosphodiesterase